MRWYERKERREGGREGDIEEEGVSRVLAYSHMQGGYIYVCTK